ncbi:hypothetical protein [Streptomyces sp. NPDC059916]|uniref:hypothetical protein n=1 Tax=Streptomyces sp. NPDC059916 TaxID=3347001 RepID=UPI0036B85CB3
MPETTTPMQPDVDLTPRERVEEWAPLLREHGWRVQISATMARARLDAFHPSGAVVMVTAGSVGRRRSEKAYLYVLKPPNSSPKGWLAVNRGPFGEFVRTGTVRSGRWVTSKCGCQKLRHATEARAEAALLDTKIRRTLHHQERRNECRVYRCPDDDRAWHLTSQPARTHAAS